jgi:sterol desaturase/sphingolipid hydroxylase (fatty acid hydroxylase superfamily)
MNLSQTCARPLASSVYPSVLISSVSVALALVDHGAAAGVAVTAAFLLALGAMAALERVRPRDRRWNPSGREAATDGAYLVMAAILQRFVAAFAHALAVTIGVAVVGWLVRRGWPHAGSSWGLAMIAFALADFGKYGLHRVAHERPWLWRFHAVHHAPARMYALNGVRLHPVNLLWNVGLDIGVPVLLGLDGRAIVLIAALRGAASVLQHANVEMRLGALNWIFSTPELHQWHHSSRLDEGSANYGSTLIVWDVVFGTRLPPRDRAAPAALGLSAGSVHPRALVHQLVWPWCERRAATCRSLRGWQPIDTNPMPRPGHGAVLTIAERGGMLGARLACAVRSMASRVTGITRG